MNSVSVVNPTKMSFKYRDTLCEVLLGEVDGKMGIFVDVPDASGDDFKSKRAEIAKALENFAAYLKAE